MSIPSDSASRRPARKAVPDATAILVLGMHRSGTSAVARMLNLCGAELGRDLLPPKQDNERGFWENSALLALHERFLDEAGLHWYDLASLPDDWREGAAARSFVAALPEVLAQQFGDSELFLVKDPRLSLLAPLWIEVLERRAVRPVFVITIRHPNEVAASLAKRDGFSYARSHVLWLQHLLEAEQATRGHRRVFVHYERVLADWRAELARIAAALGITWPNAGTDIDQQIAAFITPSLRHHSSDAPEPAASLPPIVQGAYAIAGSAATDSASPSAFDAVGSAFADAVRLAGPLIRDLSEQLARGSESHAAEIDQARTTIDDFAAQIAHARAAHESRDRLESDLRGELAASVEEVERARNTIDALAADLDRAREGFAAKEREIGAARDNIDALAIDLARAGEVIALKDREIEAARRNIDGFIDELALARAAITAKEREIDAARGNIGALAADLDQARSVIEARSAELDAARDSMNALNAQIESAREGFAAKDAELAAARANIDALVAEIGRAREAHAARDVVEAELRSEIAALGGEVAALRGSRWFRLGRKLGLIGRNSS